MDGIGHPDHRILVIRHLKRTKIELNPLSDYHAMYHKVRHRHNSVIGLLQNDICPRDTPVPEFIRRCLNIRVEQQEHRMLLPPDLFRK